MQRRYELNPQLWELIEPLLPHPTHHGGPGRPWHDHYTIINGILWMLHSGAPWRDLPQRYGPWQTVSDRFHWPASGTTQVFRDIAANQAIEITEFAKDYRK